MRGVLTTLAEISGLGCLTVAGFETAPALGWLTAGLSLVAIGVLEGRK